MRLLFVLAVAVFLTKQSIAAITCVDGPTNLKNYAQQKPDGTRPAFQVMAISPIYDDALLKVNWGSGTIENGIWSYKQSAYISQIKFGDFDANRGRYLGKSGLFAYVDGQKGNLLKVGRSSDPHTIFEFSADQSIGEYIQTFELSPSGQLLAILVQDRTGVSYLNLIDLTNHKVNSKVMVGARINSTLTFNSEEGLYFSQRSPGFTPKTYTKLFKYNVTAGTSDLFFESEDNALSTQYLVTSEKIIFGRHGFAESIEIYERSGTNWTLKKSVPNSAVFTMSNSYIVAMNERYDYAQDRVVRLYDLSGNLKGEFSIGMEVEDMIFDSLDQNILKLMNSEGSLCRLSL